MRWGEPVARAAVETGTHYVDTTGEQNYIELLHRPLRRRRARRRGRRDPRRRLRLPAERPDRDAHRRRPRPAARADDRLRDQRRPPDPRHDPHRAGAGARRRPRSTRAATGARRRCGVRRARFRFPDPVGWQPVTRYPSGEIAMVPRHIETERLNTVMTVETLAGDRRLRAAGAAADAGLRARAADAARRGSCTPASTASARARTRRSGRPSRSPSSRSPRRPTGGAAQRRRAWRRRLRHDSEGDRRERRADDRARLQRPRRAGARRGVRRGEVPRRDRPRLASSIPPRVGEPGAALRAARAPRR